MQKVLFKGLIYCNHTLICQSKIAVSEEIWKAHECPVTVTNLPSCPNTVSGRTSWTPGVSIGTRIMLCWPCLKNKFTLRSDTFWINHAWSRSEALIYSTLCADMVGCVGLFTPLTKQEVCQMSHVCAFFSQAIFNLWTLGLQKRVSKPQTSESVEEVHPNQSISVRALAEHKTWRGNRHQYSVPHSPVWK